MNRWIKVGKNGKAIVPTKFTKVEKIKRNHTLTDLPKDVLLMICYMVGVNQSGRLKKVCKQFNSWIDIVCLHMYTCILGQNKLPLENSSNINCLKLSVRHFKKNIEKVKKEFKSEEFRLMSIVIWSRSMNAPEKYGIASDFVPTNILINEKVSFIKKCVKAQWILKYGTRINKKYITYIEKELRYIQKEVWSFPYSHVTSLKLICARNKKPAKLSLVCACGDIFKKTVGVLNNLMKVFKLEKFIQKK